MKTLTFKRWVKSVVVALGLATLGACSASGPEQASDDATRRGNLAVALKTTAASGATYYLENATIVVTTERGVPVAALSSDEDPESELLSVELGPGRYLVSLEEGWTLTRHFDGNVVNVPATLLSLVTQLAVVRAQELSLVSYRFSTEEEDVSFARGSIGVSISVEESGTCGNGVTEVGEVCDAGADSGRPDQCDAACQFECEGACPLRVDPSAEESGDGSSWSSPLRSVQAAVHIQGALGGGEVWVRGPGPYEDLSPRLSETLIELDEGVAVIGGFEGTERTRGERDPAARTRIEGVAIDAPAPLVIVASHSAFEGFEVDGYWGPILRVEDAEDFRIADLSILRGGVAGLNGRSLVEILDSRGTLEGLLVTGGTGSDDGVAGVYVEGSDVLISDSEFSGLWAIGRAGIAGLSSRLVANDVRFIGNITGSSSDCAGVCVEDSDVLVVDSLFLRNGQQTPTVSARDSRFVAVGSHWEDNQSDFTTATFIRGSTSLLNCSFVDNHSWSAGNVYASGGDIEIVNTTFYQNTCSGYEDCPEDVGFSAGTQVTLSNSFSDAGSESIRGSYSGSGNCLLTEPALPYVREELGYSQVFLTEDHGCADIGDDAAALDSAASARAFAVELGVTPPLEAGAWWESLSSVYPRCGDTGPIDPGRHFEPAWCDVP